MKNQRCGKAAIFSNRDVEKIRKAFTIPYHRCIFEIALYTGERMGAIVQLKVSDVYADPAKRTLRDVINFAARTRKKRPDGSTQTRQVPVHPDLKSFLTNYEPPRDGYLFPSNNGRVEAAPKHISRRAIDSYWRKQFLKLGLDHRGFSTHSTRRWLITKLARNGVDIKTIQQITGHKNVAVLLEYIEADEKRIRNALATISP